MARANADPVTDPLALPPVPPEAAADHPLRDRVVIALFALMLVVPAAGVIVKRQLTTTAFENRTAAAWPAWPADVATFRAWPTTFERAFADRFGLRDRLIELHHTTKALVFGISPVDKVLIGTDGWLYFLGEDGKAIDRDWRGVAPYPADETQRVARELKRRHDWLAARGIPYVVAIVPDKTSIYPEHLPAWARLRARETRLDRLYAALRATPEVAVLDLRPALVAAKSRERIYFKTDSHWNLAGALVGHDAIVDAVAARVPGLRHFAGERPPYVPGVDTYSGDLARMLGLPQQFVEEDLVPLGKLLANSAARCARRVSAVPARPAAPATETWECAAGNVNALVFRDSMAIPLIPLLAEHFARSTFVETREMPVALVDAERPAVVIEEMVERSLHAPAASPLTP